MKDTKRRLDQAHSYGCRSMGRLSYLLIKRKMTKQAIKEIIYDLEYILTLLKPLVGDQNERS